MDANRGPYETMARRVASVLSRADLQKLALLLDQDAHGAFFECIQREAAKATPQLFVELLSEPPEDGPITLPPLVLRGNPPGRPEGEALTETIVAIADSSTAADHARGITSRHSAHSFPAPLPVFHTDVSALRPPPSPTRSDCGHAVDTPCPFCHADSR